MLNRFSCIFWKSDSPELSFVLLTHCKSFQGSGFLMSSRVDYNFRPQVITEMKQMQEGDFDFEDLIHKDETLARMNTMRKEGQFCDAILEIDGKSIYGHRIVLASSNVFFFEFFSTHEEKSGRKGASTIFKLDEFHLDYFAVQLLVNYFYSGRYLFFTKLHFVNDCFCKLKNVISI